MAEQIYHHVKLVECAAGFLGWLLRAFTRLRSTEEGRGRLDDNISRAEIRKWSPLLSLGMNCQLNFCQISTTDTLQK